LKKNVKNLTVISGPMGVKFYVQRPSSVRFVVLYAITNIGPKTGLF